MLNLKDLFKSAFSKGLFHLLTSNLLVQFFGFGLILFLTNLLTPSEIGLLKLIQSYAAFFIVLGSMGYSSSILKLCSEDVPEKQKNGEFSYALRMVCKISIFSVLCFILFSQSYIAMDNPVLADWMSLYSLAVPFSALGYCLIAFLQSQKKVKEASKAQVIVRLFFVGVIFVSANLWGFEGVIYSAILSYIIGLLLYLPYFEWRVLTASVIDARKGVINKYSFVVFAGALVTLVSQYSDIYLLNYLGVSVDVIGFYAIATVFFMAGVAFTGTVQTVLTPYFSEMQHDLSWVRQKTIKYQLIVSIVSFATAVGLSLLCWLLVKYHYGEQYNLAFEIVLILMVKFWLWSNYSVIGASLFAIGVVKIGVVVALVCSLVSLLSGYLLYFKYGVYGVALGQVVAYLVNLVIIYMIFNSRTKYKMGSKAA
ncbi:MAG: oligosaccharide flippase family protein [Cycloclasticus sp.]|jgi:Membrane protein involved in the export of O-antigen and teichoic acid